MRRRYLRRALVDLQEIGRYIGRDNRVAAQRWLGRLRSRAAAAALSPLTGRVVPELGRDDVREVFLRTYRIIYRIDVKEILILAFVEGSQQLRVDPDAAE